jgi:hypothetical protein
MAASHICLSGVRLLFLIPTLSVGSMVGNASTARIARDPKLKFERWMNGGDPGRLRNRFVTADTMRKRRQDRPSVTSVCVGGKIHHGQQAGPDLGEIFP